MKVNETDPDDEQLRALVNGVRQNMSLGHMAVAFAGIALAHTALQTGGPWFISVGWGAVAALYGTKAAAYWSARARGVMDYVPKIDTPKPIDQEALRRAKADDFWRGEGR